LRRDDDHGCGARLGGAGVTGSPHPLAEASYAELTTFRRTGAGVPTPVWIAPAVDGTDRLVVISVDGTGKTKRLAHTSRVELRACDVRGRVRDGTPTYRGEAVVVRDAAGIASARRALVAKYGLPARLSDLVSSVTDRLGIRRAPRAAVLIDVEPEPVPPGDVTA
jgi:PPOX class probable F420-dependent enzyme